MPRELHLLALLARQRPGLEARTARQTISTPTSARDLVPGVQEVSLTVKAASEDSPADFRTSVIWWRPLKSRTVYIV